MDHPDDAVTPWLTRSKPSGFASSADILLVLTDDDNQELPVHAAFLASQSAVLCDMLYSSNCKAVAREDVGKVVRKMPLPNASLKQATSFSNFIYFQGEPGRPELHLAMDDVVSMTELLHRFDCTMALEKLDVYLARKAGFDTYDTKPSIPCSGGSHSVFQRLHMPAVLVCQEDVSHR